MLTAQERLGVTPYVMSFITSRVWLPLLSLNLRKAPLLAILLPPVLDGVDDVGAKWHSPISDTDSDAPIGWVVFTYHGLTFDIQPIKNVDNGGESVISLVSQRGRRLIDNDPNGQWADNGAAISSGIYNISRLICEWRVWWWASVLT